MLLDWRARRDFDAGFLLDGTKNLDGKNVWSNEFPEEAPGFFVKLESEGMG